MDKIEKVDKVIFNNSSRINSSRQTKITERAINRNWLDDKLCSSVSNKIISRCNFFNGRLDSWRAKWKSAKHADFRKWSEGAASADR